MKLYKVPNNILVKVLPQPVEEIVADNGQLEMNFRSPCEISVPPSSPNIEVGEYIHFGYIDGMYSFCHNMEGEIVHMTAWAEVEPVDWSYENMALLRTIIKRGGHGKDGTDGLKWVTTDQMTDDWVAACITYEKGRNPTNSMIEFYKWELKYREEHGITINE